MANGSKYVQNVLVCTQPECRRRKKENIFKAWMYFWQRQQLFLVCEPLSDNFIMASAQHGNRFSIGAAGLKPGRRETDKQCRGKWFCSKHQKGLESCAEGDIHTWARNMSKYTLSHPHVVTKNQQTLTSTHINENKPIILHTNMKKASDHTVSVSAQLCDPTYIYTL